MLQKSVFRSKNTRRILVVGDDQAMTSVLAIALEDQGYQCHTATSGNQAIASIHQNRFDLIITEIKMDKFDGMSFIRSVKTIDSTLPIIIMTSHGSIDTAVKVMRAGAFDYILKPVGADELLVHVEKALASREVLVEIQELKDQLHDFQVKNVIVGKSVAMRKIITQIEQIAPSTANVLITGETGTGKEMLANAIHALSSRSDSSLIKVNCGALPESLLETELFGHVRGAFTGAYKDHRGRFEAANGGTIFLDEIGEMSPSAQVRLLRVLQEGVFERVGSNRPVKVDVRVIAATNQNLNEKMTNGTFREDLLYRINVFQVAIPPLRERKGDIPLLAHFFIDRYAPQNNKTIYGLGQNALMALEHYQWPGNVRELENVIEHAVIMARGDRIQLEDLPEFFHDQNEQSHVLYSDRIVIPLGFTMDQAEAIVLRRTMEMTHGDKEATAKILGFSPRTLYRKLKEHNIALNHGLMS